MERFGAIDELQSGERQDAVPVERGLEGKVETGEGFDRRQPGHLDRHLTRRFTRVVSSLVSKASIASTASISPRSMPRRVT